MKTRRPQGIREWGYRELGTEYFHFVGTREDAIREGRCNVWRGDKEFEICEGRLTWREDERFDGLECNEDDEWFICVGKPERITNPPHPDWTGENDEENLREMHRHAPK